jgi:hypothetical protein
MSVLTAKKATWRTLPPNVWENCKETLPSAAANLAVDLWVCLKTKCNKLFLCTIRITF